MIELIGPALTIAILGAIARTATNIIRNGGTSPIAGLVHAATLVLVLVLAAPLAADIALAALAAIQFVVAWNMSEARHFAKMVRWAPPDVGILLVTFFLTVFADLVEAVNIGVILAILQFLRRMVGSVQVQQLTHDQLARQFPQQGSTELVYAVEGPFFLGAVETFERALASTHTDPKILIIRLRSVPFIDVTGLQTLEEVVHDLHRRHVRVMLTGANPTVSGKLRRAGIIELVGANNVIGDFADGLAACRAMIEKDAAPACV